MDHQPHQILERQIGVQPVLVVIGGIAHKSPVYAKGGGVPFEDEYPDLDPGITAAVRALRDGGVETFESCEGGNDHAYPEPTVRFYGPRSAGWHALMVAQDCRLPVKALRRTWPLLDGEPVGPYWEMTFTERLS